MSSDLGSTTFLVTGARGQLGLHVVKDLATRGAANVLALDVKPHSMEYPGDRSGVVEHVTGDLRDEKLLEELVPRSDVVIHLGAVLSVSTREDPRASLDVNVAATHHLLRLAREHSVRRFVFGSSVNVHGDYREPDAVIRESDALRSRNMYAASKIAGEAYGYAFAAAGGAPFVALRFGVIYGPEQHDYGLIPSLVVKALEDIEVHGRAVVPADPESSVDLLYVQDASEAVFRAAMLPIADVSINVISGRPTSLGSLLQLALTLDGKGNASELLRWEVPADQPRRHMNFDPELVHSLLGFVPSTNVAFGLGEYLSWRRARTGQA